MDILTGNFTGSIGPNDTLKLINFIYDCDHYDETEFPWHFKTINILTSNLEENLCNLSEVEKAEILIASSLGSFQSDLFSYDKN